ncbi:hypothetical protein Q7C18_10125 [Nesterenkonia sp. CL21]|uniref:hypothetical protein n=1 Tax=Nesterenkonia sp. CL21 TaxID=3064894 RepID=UPI0028788DC9|nr:hypothetical protein [Nesterenkonia sp. CL21]MDS2173055.1 hypothetical protein [Nesterenkonia sp. CL21]
MDPPAPQFPVPVPVRPHTADHGPFTVRVSGGDTTIDVAWETLLAASSHVGAAQELAGRQLDDVAANNTLLLVPRPQIPHWRAPLLVARSASLSMRIIWISGLVEKCVSAIEYSHDKYREGESMIRRWLQISELISETSYVIDQAGQGDGRLAGDWARSLGVLGGQEALRLVAAYFTRGRSGLGGGRPSGRDRFEDGAGFGFLAIAKLQEENALAAYEMARHDLRLGDQTGTSFHHGDGTLHSWYQQMGQVSEEGDLAVTTVAGDSGETTYMVHLPGLDMDITDLNRQDGRGYLGLVDSAFNDAEQLADVVDEALESLGAQEGDQIALSGYSLGGIAVTNLVRNGRLGEKYDLVAATSIGAPGRHGGFPPGTQTSTTHIQNRRDPVPHLLGEHQGTGVNRQVIEVAHHNEDARPEDPSLFGDAHSYQHYLDIVEELETNPEEHLGEGGDALLRDFSTLYQGQAETHVFRTGWEENPDSQDPDLFDPEFWEATGLTTGVWESIERLDVLGIGDAFGPVTPVEDPETPGTPDLEDTAPPSPSERTRGAGTLDSGTLDAGALGSAGEEDGQGLAGEPGGAIGEESLGGAVGSDASAVRSQAEAAANPQEPVRGHRDRAQPLTPGVIIPTTPRSGPAPGADDGEPSVPQPLTPAVIGPPER